jgi:hypothetical protein
VHPWKRYRDMQYVVKSRESQNIFANASSFGNGFSQSFSEPT